VFQHFYWGWYIYKDFGRKLARISEDNHASLKEECLFTFFINFILEKERSHKYVKPNMEKI